MDNNSQEETDVRLYQINFDQQGLEQQVQVLQAQVNFLQAENEKLNKLNLKLYERLATNDKDLIKQTKLNEELLTKINQDSQLITDLRLLVSQQRDFIEQVNNDQAYNDLTEELEISLLKISNLEKENTKLLENNLQIKTKYEESLNYIKNAKLLNYQDITQSKRIQELEDNLLELQKQLSKLDS